MQWVEVLGLAMTCMSYICPLRKMDQEFGRVTLISVQHQWIPWSLFLITGCRVLSARSPLEIIFYKSIGAKFTSFQGFSPFVSAVHHSYVHNFGDSLGKMEKIKDTTKQSIPVIMLSIIVGVAEKWKILL